MEKEAEELINKALEDAGFDEQMTEYCRNLVSTGTLRRADPLPPDQALKVLTFESKEDFYEWYKERTKD